MKLLFDENISFRIVKNVNTMFPGSAHVTDVNPRLEGDIYARQHEFTIVTFDEDYQYSGNPRLST